MPFRPRAQPRIWPRRILRPPGRAGGADSTRFRSSVGLSLGLVALVLLVSVTLPGTSTHASAAAAPTQPSAAGVPLPRASTTARSSEGSPVAAAGSPVAYGNATFVLPDLTCYGQYQAKPGGDEDCQTPLLSWTADGAYYVNSSSDLTFYSFVNLTAYSLGPWTLLWQTFAQYPMIPNELFLTQDGSWVYSWGALTSSTATLTAEAVNVTTHQRFEYNFTGVNTSSVYSNGQAEMTGYDGNDSWFTLILSDGRVVSHNIWSDTQATAATFNWFEANNAYWVPYLNGYVNVEGGGSAGDHVEEWQMTSQDGALVKTFSDQWSTHSLVVNGVNGWSYNVTSHFLYLSGGGPAGNNEIRYRVNASSGTLAGPPNVIPTPNGVSSVATTAAPYRGSLVSDGYLYAVNYATTNDSFLLTPPTTATPTNASPGLNISSLANTATLNAPWYQDTAFFNTSYFIDMSSAACPHGSKSVFSHLLGECTVNSTGFPHGTIYYAWQLGLPEFPFPATAAPAQSLPPSPVSAAAEPNGATNATLAWALPTAGSDPVVNWTLAWLVNKAATTLVPLPASTRSYEITGLASGDLLTYCLEAWNLHWHSACQATMWVVGSPPAPTGLAVVAETSSSVTLEWNNPPGPLTNDTVYFGPSGCFGPWTGLSTGGVVSTATVSGLSAASTYCFRVTAWNASGESSPSGSLTISTLSSGTGTYSVMFSESGLPSGLSWTATLNGVEQSVLTDGATDNLTWLGLPDGTHGYQIEDTAGWHQTTLAYAGDVTVSGADVIEPTLVYSEVVYHVTFNETGLPPATEWWVNLTNGPAFPSSTNSLTFTEPNATYDYSLATVNPQYGSSGGSFSVDGQPASENVTFTATYSVTFVESGLPNGTHWSVNLTGGASYASAGDSLGFVEPNGTYDYTAATTDPTYAPAPATGSFGVDGAPVRPSVTFRLVTTLVTFTESGSPNGTDWWVNVTGQLSPRSTTPTTTLGLPNGTYTYTVATTDTSYRAGGGGFSVRGASLRESVTFVLVTYAVTFLETGLPSGTNWTVSLNGTPLVSATSRLAFQEPNDTYSFTIGAVPGYTHDLGAGAITVNGTAVQRSVTFSSTSGPGTVLGLPTVEGYALLGGILAAILVAVMGAVEYGRRRKASPRVPPP